MSEFMNTLLVIKKYTYVCVCAIISSYNSNCLNTDYITEFYWFTFIHKYMHIVA